MKKELKEKIVTFLTNNIGKSYNLKEIGEYLFHTYPELKDYYEKQILTHRVKKTAISQLTAEISSKYLSDSSFSSVIERKKVDKLWEYNYKVNLQLTTQVNEIIKKNEDNEHSLYPLLNKYLKSIGIRSKRIDEKKSKNSKGGGGNKWLHPDLVGIKINDEKFNKEIKECLNNFAYNRVEMLSYEVKKAITISDVRESFFQTVSNSSWSNVGYLVATEIKGDKTFEELSILSSLHGIGFILLNKDNPIDSKVLLPANHKTQVDWSTINRIAEENCDFEEYIIHIKEYFQTSRIREGDWSLKD